jgi:hypothetical protein
MLHSDSQSLESCVKEKANEYTQGSATFYAKPFVYCLFTTVYFLHIYIYEKK